jgi:hypothetical protein
MGIDWRVKDKRALRLIRKDLEAGVMVKGMVMEVGGGHALNFSHTFVVRAGWSRPSDTDHTRAPRRAPR